MVELKFILLKEFIFEIKRILICLIIFILIIGLFDVDILLLYEWMVKLLGRNI